MAEMTKEARDARNAYRRKWAKENREKIREQQRRYWERKAARSSETCEDGKECEEKAAEACEDGKECEE